MTVATSHLWASVPLLALLTGFSPLPEPVSSPPVPKRAPVLVELFSSEGCSSCPPADALLRKLDSDQSVAGAEVVAIEEHVDYWNEGGWNDPFSSADWTKRQQLYDGRPGAMFTPQMVIDGHPAVAGEAVGADEVARAARNPKATVTLTPGGLDEKSGRVGVAVGPLTGAHPDDEAEVWLAVCETNLQSSVTKGENAGHTLQHGPVLRSLTKLGTAHAKDAQSFAGDGRFRVGSHWNPKNLRVVVFVQERKSLAILGAASASLGS